MDAIFKPSSFVPLITISWIRAADTPRVRRSILWTSRCAVSGRAAACRWSACRWSTSIRWRRATAFSNPCRGRSTPALRARAQDFRSGDDYTAYDIALEQSLSLGRQQALRLAFGTQRERGREWGSGTLSWQWYF